MAEMRKKHGSMGDDTPLAVYQINIDHSIIFLDKTLAR